eukprot:Gb_38903 [translate_table: standard]
MNVQPYLPLEPIHNCKNLQLDPTHGCFHFDPLISILSDLDARQLY